MSCQGQKTQIQFHWSFLIIWEVKFRNSWRRHARALMSTYMSTAHCSQCSWNEHANHPAANKQVTHSLFKDPVAQCPPFNSSQDEDSNPPISPLRSGCVSFLIDNQTVNNITTMFVPQICRRCRETAEVVLREHQRDHLHSADGLHLLRLLHLADHLHWQVK